MGAKGIEEEEEEEEYRSKECVEIYLHAAFTY
jgi:hypothetical protein